MAGVYVIRMANRWKIRLHLALVAFDFAEITIMKRWVISPCHISIKRVQKIYLRIEPLIEIVTPAPHFLNPRGHYSGLMMYGRLSLTTTDIIYRYQSGRNDGKNDYNTVYTPRFKCCVKLSGKCNYQT